MSLRYLAARCSQLTIIENVMRAEGGFGVEAPEMLAEHGGK